MQAPPLPPHECIPPLGASTTPDPTPNSPVSAKLAAKKTKKKDNHVCRTYLFSIIFLTPNVPPQIDPAEPRSGLRFRNRGLLVGAAFWPHRNSGVGAQGGRPSGGGRGASGPRDPRRPGGAGGGEGMGGRGAPGQLWHPGGGGSCGRPPNMPPPPLGEGGGVRLPPKSTMLSPNPASESPGERPLGRWSWPAPPCPL